MKQLHFYSKLLICLVCFGMLSMGAAYAVPKIFNVTTTALPGEVFGVQGDDFGTSPTIFIDKGEGVFQLSPISVSNNYVAALVPETFGRGHYTVYVKNGNTQSNSVYINQPQPWWGPLDLAGTQIDPGRVFRLQGRNLDLPGATSTVKFKAVADGTTLTAVTVDADDQFLLKATAPAGLVVGAQYDIYVSNGYGGASGEVIGPRVTACATGTDTWGLAIPWAAEFTFAGNEYNVKTDSRLTNKAVGDGTADDRPAIQEAIDKANAAGGGVVYLPSGSYNILATGLVMKSDVVIKGEGKTVSKIIDNNSAADGNMVLASNLFRIGFVDVAFESGANSFNNTARIAGCTFAFALRSRFSNARKETFYGKGCKSLLLKETDVIHTPHTGKHVITFNEAKNVFLKDSYIQWSDGRVVMMDAAWIQVEENQFIRSVLTDRGGPYEFGGLAIGANYITILGNTFDKLGDGKLPQANDGETILNQNTPASPGQGHATDGTPTSITDATKTFLENEFVGRTVILIQGPGMGQERLVTSNTTNSITVSPAWDITPTSGTYYTVLGKVNEQLLIKGNTLKNVPRGIWLYSNAIRDVSIVGNQLIDGENIYLRGDQRVNDRFVVQKNILIENNNLSSPQDWYSARIRIQLSQVSVPELYGNAFYNVVARGNTAEGFVSDVDVQSKSTSDNNTAGVLGVIWQDNTALSTPYAHYLNHGAYQTIIWNTNASGAGALLSDTRGPGATHASVGTVIGPEGFSDSIIQLPKYSIQLLILDSLSLKPVEGLKLSLAGSNYVTDSEGKLIIPEMSEGYYNLSLPAKFFINGDSEIEVRSDSLIQILVTEIPWLYLKVIDRTSESPVYRVGVTVNGTLYYSDNSGLIELGVYPSGPLHISVSHKDYFPLSDTLFYIGVTQDTGMTLTLTPKLARVTFQVSDLSGPLSSAKVIMTSSQFTNSSGRALFYSQPARMNYEFTVSKFDYNTVQDTLFLETDTTLMILLEKVVAVNNTDLPDLLIKPNPFDTYIHIILQEKAQLILYDISGIMRLTMKMEEGMNIIPTAFLEKGFYMMKISSNEQVLNKLMVK